eukprot:UN23573
MTSQSELFSWKSYSDPLLIILDRREDPVTPLLTQWTYQAMVHEILTINNSRVNLKGTGQDKLGEVTLNTFDDEFFKKHQMNNFGELGVAVRGLVEKYQKRKKDNSNIESIADMQRFVDTYQDYMQSSNSTSKHIGLLTELSETVKSRKLLNLSEVEQKIACTENLSQQYDEVEMQLKNPKVTFDDKIKLVILFALRYEKSGADRISKLKGLLRAMAGHNDTDLKKVRHIDLVLNTCGRNYRHGDLFGNNTFAKRMTGMLKGLKGVDNIYTRHTPYLDNI